MKRGRLLKQGLAVLLSLSMSLGPCAPPFAAFAAEAMPGESSAVTAVMYGQNETATGSDAREQGENKGGNSQAAEASPADALYDEDGFLLDGTVADDRPDEEMLPEELAEEVLSGRKGDWTVLKAEAEEIKVTVFAEKDVLPKETVLEAELQEESGVSLVQLRFLDAAGEEIQPDREKGKLYVTFSNIARPENTEGNALPDDALSVWGLRYFGDDEGKELEKVGEKEEDILLSGALLSADFTEGAVYNDLQDAAETGTASNAGTDQGPASVTVRAAEGCAIFALAWSMAGALLKTDGHYTVTFDYGGKLIWKNSENQYCCFTTNEDGSFMYESAFDTREEAEAAAAQKVSYISLENEALWQYVPYTTAGAERDGKTVFMENWMTDDGETLGLDDTYSYYPSGDMTFRLQTTEAADVTFDYGAKLCWQEWGTWYAMIGDGDSTWQEPFATREEAENAAVQQITFKARPGVGLGHNIGYTSSVISVDGHPARMTGWYSDAAGYLALEDAYGYVPETDAVFQPQWDTDYRTLAFDYGVLPVWEENGEWRYIQGGYIYSEDSREAAEKKAEQKVERYLSPWDQLYENLSYPEVPIQVNGELQLLTGWTDENGAFYGKDELYGLDPAGDLHLTAQWDPDVCKVTFDYGTKVVWQNGGDWWYIAYGTNQTYMEHAESEEEAKANAVQEAVFYVTEGTNFPYSVYYMYQPVSVDGQLRLMTAWESDDGQILEPENLWQLVPDKDVTLQMQWDADFYTVTVDYGKKLAWEDQYGFWYAVALASGSNAVQEQWFEDRETAERHAVEHYDIYVKQGDLLEQSLWYPSVPVPLEGRKSLMTGWETDQGEALGLDDTYGYLPSGDCTLRAQWADEIYSVTFDYGEKLVWEENGFYRSIYYASDSNAAWDNGYATYEEAEEQASEFVTFEAAGGAALQKEMPYPNGIVEINGQLRKLEAWESDSGETLAPWDVHDYVPTGDITFRPKWCTDIYTVTFDYGDGIVWKHGNRFGTIVEGSGSTWTEYFDTEEEAADAAVRTLSVQVLAGETLNMLAQYPWDEPIEADGQIRMMTGWENENGDRLDRENSWSYVPSGSVTFRPVWTEEICKVTFDYGSRLIWESSGNPGWYFFICEEGYVESAQEREIAEELAVQTFTLYVQKGKEIGYEIDGPSGYIKRDGDTVRLTNWKNDSGESFSGYQLMHYAPETDQVFRAQWEEAWVVTLHENSGPEEDEQIWTLYVRKGDLCAPGNGSNAAQQYMFQGGEDQLIYGWSTERDTPVEELHSGAFRPESDMDLYAIWDRGCVIELDTDGGEMYSWQETRYVRLPGLPFYLFGLEPKKEGFTFEGWTDAETGKRIYDECIYPQKDTTLRAKYSGSVSVTFVENFEGSTEERTVSFTENWETKVRRYFERDGYALLGYSTDKDASLPEYAYGTFYTPEEGMKLYGIWEKTWDLTIDLNGGMCVHPYYGGGDIFYRQVFDGHSVLEEITTWYNGRIKDEFEFVCEGKVFGGWFYDAEGTQAVAEEDLASGDLTVYAKWTDGWHVTVDYGDYGVYPEDETGYEEEKYIDFYVPKGESLTQPDIRYETGQYLSFTGYRVDGKIIPTLEGYTPTKDTQIQAVISTDNLAVLRFHEAQGSELYGPTDWFGNVDGEWILCLATQKGSTLNTALMELPWYEIGRGRQMIQGWSLEKDGTEPVDFSTYVFTEDETELYPIVKKSVPVGFVLSQRTDRKVNVSFPEDVRRERNGRDGDYVRVLFEKGSLIDCPADTDIHCGGLVFRGWYDNADYEGEPIFIPSSKVKAETEMTLFAKWTEWVDVTGVTLDQETLELKVGESFALSAAVAPEDADDQNVSWSSSDEAVAVADRSGKVTAKKSGQAVITVTTEEGGFTAECRVTVTQPVTGVTISKTASEVTEGESFTLTAGVVPADADNKNISWSSSDPAVASVDQTGKVTALKAGTARITVTTEDGKKTAYCNVSVKPKDLKAEFVKRLYRTCFGREADAGGLNYWCGLLNNGTKKGIRLAGDFVFSKEFTNKNYCNEHFVRQLYLALMGRDPAADPDGVKYWTGVLDRGTTREALLNGFTSTAEYKKLCADAGIELGNKISDTTYKCKQGVGTKPYGPCAVCGSRTKVVQFAEMMYTECLKRAADASGLAYWSKGLYEQTITGKAILNSFFLSPEIKNKNLSSREYVTRIYKVMLNRSPDSGGLEYWAGRLDKGASPAAVIGGFVDSAEFTRICSDYGIKRK